MSSPSLPNQSIYLVWYNHFDMDGYREHGLIGLCMTLIGARQMLKEWAEQLAGEDFKKKFQQRFGLPPEAYMPLFGLSIPKLEKALETHDPKYDTRLISSYEAYKANPGLIEDIMDEFNYALERGAINTLNPETGPWPIHPFAIYEALPEFAKELGYNGLDKLKSLVNGKVNETDKGYFVSIGTDEYNGLIDRIDPSMFCP